VLKRANKFPNLSKAFAVQMSSGELQGRPKDRIFCGKSRQRKANERRNSEL